MLLPAPTSPVVSRSKLQSPTVLKVKFSEESSSPLLPVTRPCAQTSVELELGGSLKTSLKENNPRQLTFRPDVLVIFRAKVWNLLQPEHPHKEKYIICT